MTTEKTPSSTSVDSIVRCDLPVTLTVGEIHQLMLILRDMASWMHPMPDKSEKERIGRRVIGLISRLGETVWPKILPPEDLVVVQRALREGFHSVAGRDKASGDSTNREAAVCKAWNSGTLSVTEVREFLGLPPIDNS